MKIPQSVRIAYEVQYERNQRLKDKVDELLRSLKKDRWHYESRLKAIESYALKLETGRYEPDKLEDFFACTLVVENQSRIASAKDLVRSNFEFKYRRPETDDFTHKSSESFPFDDLRLYVTYKDNLHLKPSGVTDILFEIQIKTFLQHAWSIATHDLTYKSDGVSWSKARIAYQIKAMLEHAEVSIEKAENISNAPELAKDDWKTKSQSEAINLIKALWDVKDLPADLVRMAHNVLALCKSLNIGMDELRTMIDRETMEGRGTKTLNLSPYCIVIQSIVYQDPQRVRDFLSTPPRHLRNFKLFIPKEIELPEDIAEINKDLLARIE
jgi:ppGpp synthetase/RelA/SpoT-type nucleotidyltranferase